MWICLLRVLGGNFCDRIPIRWWFGFSRSYEDGRAGEEGRSCHVLSEIEFGGVSPGFLRLTTKHTKKTGD